MFLSKNESYKLFREEAFNKMTHTHIYDDNADYDMNFGIRDRQVERRIYKLYMCVHEALYICREVD